MKMDIYIDRKTDRRTSRLLERIGLRADSLKILYTGLSICGRCNVRPAWYIDRHGGAVHLHGDGDGGKQLGQEVRRRRKVVMARWVVVSRRKVVRRGKMWR